MKVYYEGDCCVDCASYLANGDIPEDRPDLEEDILREWPDPSTYHLVNGDSGENGEHDTEFSKSPCDCCGSSLAGSRMPFVVLTEKESYPRGGMICASQNPRFNRDRWLGSIAGTNGPNGGKKVTA